MKVAMLGLSQRFLTQLEGTSSGLGIVGEAESLHFLVLPWSFL